MEEADGDGPVGRQVVGEKFAVAVFEAADGGSAARIAEGCEDVRARLTGGDMVEGLLIDKNEAGLGGGVLDCQ
jgi:predicted RecA/RadA family phage recombinase